jgi:phosphate starvation-inducible protein PhoH
MKNRSRQNSLDFGEEPSEDKRRARKSKKNNNAELMNEFRDEIDDESSFAKQRAYYENLHHLSSNERAMFDAKFTKPKNDSQTYYATLLKQKSKKIVVATGPAGTGKTLFATEYGVKMFLTGQYEKLIFTRPSVSVDEDLGYLPGTLEDKIIEISPLGFMRGRTFKNCWIVADEMQNSSISQMKMLMTRLGENSRLVVTGDLEQYDRVNEVNGLEDFLSKFKGKRSSSISSIEFYKSDIQREEVVKEVLDIYGGDMPADYITENVDEESENEK